MLNRCYLWYILGDLGTEFRAYHTLTTYPATKLQVTAPALYVTFSAEKGNTTLTQFKPSPVAKTNWWGAMQES